jgi:hypothetical protein
VFLVSITLEKPRIGKLGIDVMSYRKDVCHILENGFSMIYRFARCFKVLIAGCVPTYNVERQIHLAQGASMKWIIARDQQGSVDYTMSFS